MSTCDFIYKKTGIACAKTGTSDDAGRHVRCKIHRVAKLRHSHPKRFINTIKRITKRMREEGSLPTLDVAQKWTLVAKLIDILFTN